MVVRSASAVSPWWIVSAKMLITSAASGPNEVRTQHTLSLLLDENLEAVRRLGNATGRIPVGYLLGVRAESPSAHVRFCLAQPNRGNGRTVSGHLHASRYLCRQALIGEIARMTAKSGISGEAATAVTHRAPRRRQESTAAHCHSERPIGAETAKVRSRRRGRGVWLSQLLQIASGSIELDFVSCARTAERL